MDSILTFFAIAGGLLGVLVNICLWSRGHLRGKVAALVVATLFLPLAYVSFANLLSRPKPIALEWAERDLAEATVVGSLLDEPNAIYFWLAFENQAAPRAYVLPWDDKLARQLHRAKQQAEAEGTRVRVQNPFVEEESDREKLFHAEPRQPLPPKQNTAAATLSP